MVFVFTGWRLSICWFQSIVFLILKREKRSYQLVLNERLCLNLSPSCHEMCSAQNHIAQVAVTWDLTTDELRRKHES